MAESKRQSKTKKIEFNKNKEITRIHAKYSLVKNLVDDHWSIKKCIKEISKNNNSLKRIINNNEIMKKEFFLTNRHDNENKKNHFLENIKSATGLMSMAMKFFTETKLALEAEQSHKKDAFKGLEEYRFLKGMLNRSKSSQKGDLITNWYLYELSLIFTNTIIDEIQWKNLRKFLEENPIFYPKELGQKINTETLRTRVNTFKSYKEKNNLAKKLKMKTYELKTRRKKRNKNR